MDELQDINNIVSEAVKNSSYVTVLISSAVYIAYTLIVKVVDLFKAKDRNKPIIEMADAIKQVSENVVKLNAVLDKAFRDAEQKEAGKVTNVISLGFDTYKSIVTTYCISVIVHNNIDINNELIKQNTLRLVSTEYYKLYNAFSAYEIDGINIASRLKEEWIDRITKECLDVIYNGQDKIARIVQVSNRLELIFNECSIYLNNKVFNH